MSVGVTKDYKLKVRNLQTCQDFFFQLSLAAHKSSRRSPPQERYI